MLTSKQSQIYQYIQNYLSHHDCAPTLREIGEAVNIKSRGVVHRHIKALIRARLLTMVKNKKRNIQLMQKKTNSQIQLPLLGKIAAGKPMEAIQQSDFLNLSELFNKPNYFLLKVVGDSMIEEGILNEDYILCENCTTAHNGEIVIALVDHYETTLKRFYKNMNGTITLKPANAKMKSLTYNAGRVIIQGRYIGLLRVNRQC